MTFLADTITRLYIQVYFYGTHSFPCQSLLLSTTVLNDMVVDSYLIYNSLLCEWSNNFTSSSYNHSDHLYH